MNDRPERDQALERLLGSLEAPAAKEHVHERLWERIDAAEAMPVARPARRRTFRRPRLAAVALAAAAVAVWVAVSLVGWPSSRDAGLVDGPPPAVAQVIQNVRLRLDSCRSLSAIFTYQRTGATPFRARVLVASDGRVRTAAIAEPDGSWRLPPMNATLSDTPGLHVEVSSLPDGTRTEAWNSENGLTVSRTVDLAPGRRTPWEAASSPWSTRADERPGHRRREGVILDLRGAARARRERPRRPGLGASV